METELARIAERVKNRPREKLTTLMHHINEEALMAAHLNAKVGKAVGNDGISKEKYSEDLGANLRNLVGRMKRQVYKPQAVRRTYIPKVGSDKMRPLGIPAYEDKLVQSGMAQLLNAVYESVFLDNSYGFRPQRSAHQALQALNHIIEKRKISYVVDADIKGFFDNVDHEWLMTFLKEHIADRNFLRLISRFLKAGVMEAGIMHDTPQGTPQGGVVSPILANVYLHYVLDLWFEKIIRKRCRGQAYLIRYADDFVCCFQFREEAEKFYLALKLRLAKFNLELAEDKSQILEFGRFAQKGARQGSRKRPGTFDFLGFTHYCDKSRDGRFRVKRKTSRKKFAASVKRCKEWLKANRMIPMNALMKLLGAKLVGYYRYYGITDNSKTVGRYYHEVISLMFKWMNRRSQRRSFTWDKFQLYLQRNPLPKPKVYVSIFDLTWANSRLI